LVQNITEKLNEEVKKQKRKKPFVDWSSKACYLTRVFSVYTSISVMDFDNRSCVKETLTSFAIDLHKAKKILQIDFFRFSEFSRV